MNNKSPLRYPGGKTRACKKLDAILMTHYDVSKINTIVSPFFGGGSFEFYLQNKYGYNIVANDKFKPLFSFWKACKDHKEALCTALRQNMQITKEDFTRFRESIMVETDQHVQAMNYFIINRCSFSGATLSGGFSQEASKKRYTASSVDRISQLDLSKFDIHNEDFKPFIKNASDEGGTLLFLDPPYYLGKKSKLYGKNGDMHEAFDHDGLYTLLSKKKGWILTYNNCDWVLDKYKEFIILDDVEWSYGMNKSKKSSELIIIG